MSYRFTWKFDVTDLSQDQVKALENESVRTDFEWELQNNLRLATSDRQFVVYAAVLIARSWNRVRMSARRVS